MDEAGRRRATAPRGMLAALGGRQGGPMAVILQTDRKPTPKQSDDLGEVINRYGERPEGGIFHAAGSEKDGLHILDMVQGES
jgi:hypothetical protein